MAVVLYQRRFLENVVVGEIRAHPALRKHGGRKFDEALYGGIPVPDVVAVFQETLAFIPGRGCNEGQRIAFSGGPTFEGQRALVGGAYDGHAHLAVAGSFSIETGISFTDEFFGLLCVDWWHHQQPTKTEKQLVLVHNGIVG